MQYAHDEPVKPVYRQKRPPQIRTYTYAKLYLNTHRWR